jgi:serine/threonine-protein kinase
MLELPGSQLAGYVVGEEVGAGSMATVYRAQDPEGRVVALKVFHEFLRDSPRMLRRFERESRLLSTLRHPKVIGFRGYFDTPEALFYAMDFVRAPTVEALLEDGPLPPEARRVVARDMLVALAHAHQQAIIHRDLKPSNLFYDVAAGEALLSDFGLAKSLLDVPITAAGTKMMGTPNYMAPEQVDGGETTVRTDVYQAGLVLFELATGLLAFRAPSPFLAITLRCKEDVPLDEGPGAEIEDGWRAVIRRACAREPEARYPSATEMLEELMSSQAALPQP